MTGHTNNPVLIHQNQKAELAVNAVDALDISMIFSMFLKNTLHALLESYLKYALFPLAAAANGIKAMLAWRQVILEHDEKTGKLKTNLIVRAIIETIVATAITIAVVGALAFSSIFSTAAPIIFAATLSFKASYHLLAGCYYSAKESVSADIAIKNESRQLADSNIVAAISGTFTTVAVVAVLIFAKPLFATLGIAAGIIGSGFAIYKLCQMVVNEIRQTKTKSLQEVSNVITESDKEETTKQTHEFVHTNLLKTKKNHTKVSVKQPVIQENTSLTREEIASKKETSPKHIQQETNPFKMNDEMPTGKNPFMMADDEISPTSVIALKRPDHEKQNNILALQRAEVKNIPNSTDSLMLDDKSLQRDDTISTLSPRPI